MKFLIEYTENTTGELKRLEINPRMDVVSITIPTQNPPSYDFMPKLKVDVNSDMVIVHAQSALGNMMKVWQQSYNEMLSDANGDGYTKPQAVHRDTRRKVSVMPREHIIDVLQNHLSIQCYDHESTEELREALLVSLLDGTATPDMLPE